MEKVPSQEAGDGVSSPDSSQDDAGKATTDTGPQDDSTSEATTDPETPGDGVSTDENLAAAEAETERAPEETRDDASSSAVASSANSKAAGNISDPGDTGNGGDDLASPSQDGSEHAKAGQEGGYTSSPDQEYDSPVSSSQELQEGSSPATSSKEVGEPSSSKREADETARSSQEVVETSSSHQESAKAAASSGQEMGEAASQVAASGAGSSETLMLKEASVVPSASLPAAAVGSASGDAQPRGVRSEVSPSRNFSVVVSSEEYDKSNDAVLLENNLLPDVDAQAVYAMLDEYQQQLEVLGKIIAAPYIKDYEDEKETLRQRFRREEDEPIKIKGKHGDHMVPAHPSMVKIQKDRAYLSKAIDRLMRALRRENSYVPLLETVEAEGIRRKEFVIIEDEAIENSQRITALQQQIKELEISMEQEIRNRNNRIFELKDELQEVLARTGMEVRYMRASMQAHLASFDAQSECRRNQMRDNAANARMQIDYETRVNTEIESNLRDSLDELNDMLDKRLTKFDVDTDTKERELGNLKYQKQQNFQALTDIKERFALYTRVIAEDDEELRLEEERIKEEARREDAAIVIQAYWKGYKERKKMRKKLKKMRKALKKAKKAGKAGGADAKGGKGKGASPKGKKKK